MSACSTTRGCMARRGYYARAPIDEERMSETAVAGGPAAGVRWDLSHLYTGPDDPQIEKDLAGALAAANAFAERYRGRVALLAAPDLARALEERVLAETHNAGSAAWSRLFDQIMADLSFEVSLGGEVKRLSEEETLALLYEPDREVRRAAAAGLSAGLRANARVLGFIFNILVQDKSADDRRRRYPHPMAARHLANE